MGIITKEVEVRVNGYTVKYYESLGYEIPMKTASKFSVDRYNKEFVYDFTKSITVKVDDLLKGSKTYIRVLCDMCKENEFEITYGAYNRAIKNTGHCICKQCSIVKQKNTVKEKYDVDNISQIDEIKNKKLIKSLDKYGFEYALQSPEVREKINKTLYQNGTQKTSKQQLYLCNLYDGKLNYSIRHYNADICFPDNYIICEYNGGGHDLNVRLGHLSQEEFDQKEIIRNNILKREGYKIITIESKKDRLPQDDVLLSMLSQARTYFQTTNHTWLTYDLDQSLMLNAENKDIGGVYYNYGQLRTISKPDNTSKVA